MLLELRADEPLYAGWGHRPVDEYPSPINREEVLRKFEIPDFLREMHRRNLSGTLQSDYEEADTFDNRIAYFLTVDEAGVVTDVACNTIGV